MHYLASLAAFAATAQSLGSAWIYNQCDFDAYIWAVDADRNPSTPTTVPAGTSWSEGYHVPTSGGVSIKIANTTSPALITQFEYTVQAFDGDNFVWYDGSNVNCHGTGCPFEAYNLFLTTSLGTACPQRNCTAGEVTCTGFYTYYNDDVNSLSCVDTADTILYLCSGGSGPASSVAPVASTVEPTSTVAPTTTAAPVETMEAVVTTLVTVTTAYPNKRHLHGRHHQLYQ